MSMVDPNDLQDKIVGDATGNQSKKTYENSTVRGLSISSANKELGYWYFNPTEKE